MNEPVKQLIDAVIATHAALRTQKPLVQCLTNAVSSNFMANVLLAAGAAPAMVDNPEEAAAFVQVASAVLVNLGTPTAAQVEAMRLAVKAAHSVGRPWVLDPIGAGGLSWRGAVAAELLAYRPAVIRGNASEIIGLAGLGSSSRGFDSSNDPADAVAAARELLAYSAAVSASGPVDHVVGTHEGQIRLFRIAGGSALLPRVTATGCSLGALVAAYTAVAASPVLALITAHVHFALAAEQAQTVAKGPGSFMPAFVDALDAVDAEQIAQHARIDSIELES